MEALEMISELLEIYRKYENDQLDEETYLQQIDSKIQAIPGRVFRFLDYIQAYESKEALEIFLDFFSMEEMLEDFIVYLNEFLPGNWHESHLELIRILQEKAHSSSPPFIEKAMQKRFAYLEAYGTGTRQFINQCGHALWDIKTQEAFNVIEKLSHSDDPILKDEMLYRISKITGRNDYQRWDERNGL